MAVSAIPVATDLVLVMDNGVGSSGQPLTISRTFKSIKPNVNNDDIYSVAQEILSLQSLNNLFIQRRDISEIEDDSI